MAKNRFNGGKSQNIPTHANAVIVGTSSLKHANRVIIDRDRDVVTGLTDVQWRGVMKLLNTKESVGYENTSSTSETLTGMCSYPFWILDTGVYLLFSTLLVL